MSGHQTEVQTIKAARKRHRCTWCWERINVGDTYKRYRMFDGGDAQTIRMHPECLGAREAAAEEEGGWYEWIPGEERPDVAT